jgi:predicted lipoprotein
MLLGCAGVAGLGVAGALACADEQDDLRPELVAAVTERLRGDLAEARARATSLREAAEALCEAPDAARLTAARDAWWLLREPWKRLLALPLGPIVDEGFDSAIDFWPVRPTSVEGGVEAGISSQAELDLLGVASKGLPALEYLLWDPVGGDAAILAGLTAADTGAARCTYLVVLAADLELRFEELETATTEFAAQLADAGSSERYPTLALAIDELLNAAISGLHAVADLELGKPLGLTTGSEPQPDLLESRLSDRSRTDLLDALEGFRRFYLGTPEPPGPEGAGFTILISQSQEAIDAAVRDQLERTLAEAEALPEPLRTVLDVDPDAATAAWTAVVELRRLLIADVAGLLGVTVSLTDNDGD